MYISSLLLLLDIPTPLSAKHNADKNSSNKYIVQKIDQLLKASKMQLNKLRLALKVN